MWFLRSCSHDEENVSADLWKCCRFSGLYLLHSSSFFIAWGNLQCAVPLVHCGCLINAKSDISVLYCTTEVAGNIPAFKLMFTCCRSLLAPTSGILHLRAFEMISTCPSLTFQFIWFCGFSDSVVLKI